MANGLYDSGKPQRIVVEHEHHHTHEVQRIPAELPPDHCWADQSLSCQGYVARHGDVCKECRVIVRRSEAKVTITPQFEHVEERKKLK